MSEEINSAEFEPVIYRSRFPSLHFHIEYPVGSGNQEEWQFENGIFLATTPEMAEAMEKHLEFLRKKQPGNAGLFVRSDKQAALELALAHQEEVRRQNKAVNGPFQADHMISRSHQAAENRAMSESPGHAANTAAVATGLAALLQNVAVSRVEENSVEAPTAEV